MVMVVSEEFNRGFWCAVQEFCAQGATNGQIIAVIRAAGLSYDECVELMEDSDYERDKLWEVVKDIF